VSGATAPAGGTRSPGRPRSAEADAAITRATLELLVEEGFQGLSVEAVRQRAGVGKATIYRRFPDKVALVRAAMDALHAQLELPDTGTLRGDLEAVWHAAYAAQPTAAQRLMLPRLLADVVEDEELFAVFHATLVEPRRAAMREIIARAVERGELRDDLDAELLIDMLAGPMIYRVLIDRGEVPDPVGRALAVYDAVAEGVTPARPSRGRPRG
jgi:AcrR family transcriptional regulator